MIRLSVTVKGDSVGWVAGSQMIWPAIATLDHQITDSTSAQAG